MREPPLNFPAGQGVFCWLSAATGHWYPAGHRVQLTAPPLLKAPGTHGPDTAPSGQLYPGGHDTHVEPWAMDPGKQRWFAEPSMEGHTQPQGHRLHESWDPTEYWVRGVHAEDTADVVDGHARPAGQGVQTEEPATLLNAGKREEEEIRKGTGEGGRVTGGPG